MDKSELLTEIIELKEKANTGDPDAQFELGKKYHLGLGVEKNYIEAINWFQKSAAQEHPRGQNALGVMYQNGFGVEQNYSKAIELYNKAISQNCPQAMCNMGMLYNNGQGVEINKQKAFTLNLKAAEQGYDVSQYNIGWMYLIGNGVNKNSQEAFLWFKKAAEQNHPEAIINIGWMYQSGEYVEKNAQEAFSWYRKAAVLGHPHAQLNVGYMYQVGQGVEKNEKEAIAWYTKAANQNDEKAQINLGFMYMNGLGVEHNYTEALHLFRQAATSVNPEFRFKAIEFQDKVERLQLSTKITKLREDILKRLSVNINETKTITHYTSLMVGKELLLKKSPLRLGHISALNDPNEGKLLWKYLGYAPAEGKPAFVGCFLPDDDSLNMWRFYSKNHHNDDACGCAITFETNEFFDFNLLPELTTDPIEGIKNSFFSNTGKSPQESANFYRIIYTHDNINIHGDDENILGNLFSILKEEVSQFLGNSPSEEKTQQVSRLLGPLPYLLKDADYEAEKEHRIIVTHLEYGAKEIQTLEPVFENGIPQTSPKLYLELHRVDHLAPVKHVTLGPKAPYQEMMAPYWHHKLASEFPDQLKAKPDFYVRISRCAYK